MESTRQYVNNWIQMAKKKRFKYIMSVHNNSNNTDFPVFYPIINDLIRHYYKHTEGDESINEIIRINDDGTVTENLNINDLI